MNRAVTEHRERAECWRDVAATRAAARDAGLDLARPAVVGYLVGLASQRDAAYELARLGGQRGERGERGARDWRTRIYADRTGWVVWISRTVSLQARALDLSNEEAADLARRHHGRVRGLCIEQPDAYEDRWAQLAHEISRDDPAARSDVSRRRRRAV